MTKIKYIIIAAISLLFALPSCSDGEEIIRLLDIKDKSVLLDNKAQTKVIEVTVDKGETFTASWSGESWGEAVANSDNGTVSISVLENATSTLRKASVMVSTKDGLRNKVIEITQNGTYVDPILTVLPDEINFELIGGEVIIEVGSNAKWEAKVDSNIAWISLKSYVQTGELIVTAGNNEDPSARTTTITVTAGTASKEIAVKQAPAPLFMFPYLNLLDASEAVLTVFEEARYSTVVPGRNPKSLTRSRLTPEIIYSIASRRISVAQVKVKPEYLPGFFGEGDSKGEIHNILTAAGYEYLFKNVPIGEVALADTYWLETVEFPGSYYKHYIVAVIPELASNGTSEVRFNVAFQKPDDPATPSFSTMPYPPLADIPWDSDQATAKAWEATNSGVITDEDADGIEFTISTGPYYKRYYFYTNNKLTSIQYLFHDYRQVALKNYYNSVFVMNAKFAGLLNNDDFELIAGSNPPAYNSKTKNMTLTSGVAKESTDGPSLGVLTYKYYDGL